MFIIVSVIKKRVRRRPWPKGATDSSSCCAVSSGGTDLGQSERTLEKKLSCLLAVDYLNGNSIHSSGY